MPYLKDSKCKHTCSHCFKDLEHKEWACEIYGECFMCFLCQNYNKKEVKEWLNEKHNNNK